MAVFSDSARSLTPNGFASGADLAAVPGQLGAALQSGGAGRDYAAAYSLAQAIISADLASSSRGERQKTRYVLSMFAEGPPVPALDSADQAALIQTVLDLSALASAQGAGQLATQIFYLPPPGGSATDSTAQLLTDLAVAAQGPFVVLTEPNALNLGRVDIQPLTVPTEIKQVFAWNRNVIATAQGLKVDSDRRRAHRRGGAGARHRPTNPDTDGDGISNGVEAGWPRSAMTRWSRTSSPADRPDHRHRRRWATDSSEMLPRTDPSLVDTDGDGMPIRSSCTAAPTISPTTPASTRIRTAPTTCKHRIHSDPWTAISPCRAIMDIDIG